MNIVWEKPDGSLAVTTMDKDAILLMDLLQWGNFEGAISLARNMRIDNLKEWIDFNGSSVKEHAYRLMERGEAHKKAWIEQGSKPELKPEYFDWKILGFDIPLPTSRAKRDLWRWNGTQIEVKE